MWRLNIPMWYNNYKQNSKKYNHQRMLNSKWIQLTALCCLLMIQVTAQTSAQRWSVQKANEWYAKQGWLHGCNYQTSTAINQLEMFQPETFDTATINKEL